MLFKQQLWGLLYCW